ASSMSRSDGAPCSARRSASPGASRGIRRINGDPGGIRNMATNQNFTEKARQAIVAGQQLTQEQNLAQYEPAALLVGLVDQPDGIVPQILQRLELEPAMVLREARDVVERSPKLQYSAEAVVSGALRKALQDAERQAQQFGDEYISTEHLFIGILEGERTPAAWLLARLGTTRERAL